MVHGQDEKAAALAAAATERELSRKVVAQKVQDALKLKQKMSSEEERRA